MERGEDQIMSSINRIKNLTLVTSSKYNELNRLLEWSKTTPLKKVFNAQPIGKRRKSRPNLRWIDGLEKYLVVLRTKNWRTQAGRMLACKRLIKGSRSTLGCRVT
ncbi:hypothetical protein TNCV_2273191 [Trichonephila clavipes]|nr:hypothetical protein TNCV_2273191 [Trichonephila clavipes]